MLIFAILAALLLAALGLCTVRTAPPVARWLALLSVLAFAVVASLADKTVPQRVVPQLQEANLVGSASEQRTAMLLAAARSGPRADEVDLVWQPTTGRFVGAAPNTFGARPLAPSGLPFAPDDVHIRATTVLRADRPAMLEIEVAGLTQEFAAELVVSDGVDAGYREQVTVAERPVTVAFTPARAGNWQVSLAITVSGHVVRAKGAFDVAPPDEILVVDRGGVVAAALRAQGERVRETALWPSDWRSHQRIVLGQVLPVAEQEALARAVNDGTGLFVLGSAFGDEGMPLRELLPVRPLPEQPETGDGPGAGEGESANEGAAKPSEQSQPDPKENVEPPANVPPPQQPDGVGDTEGSKDVSKDPIEVDRHSVAMVLVVDRSESMGTEVRPGWTRMSYAKTSALRTALALDEGDRVGLVTFGNIRASRVELPMTDVLDTKAVQAGVAKLSDGREYTYVLGAMKQAHKMLREEDAAVKHVVIITDGGFQDSPVALPREAHRMRTEGKITMSIVLIVTDEELGSAEIKLRAQAIAKDGGGKSLSTGDAQAVPVIVSTEVSRALSRVGREPRRPGDANGEQKPDKPAEQPPDKPEEPTKPEEPDKPEPQPEQPTEADEPEPPQRLVVRAVVDSPLLAPEPKDWPTLGSAVHCEAPLESRVLLIVGDEGWPLLAYANRGLGRVAAFCADLGGESGREFREAEPFPGWLAQWLAATSAAVPSTESRDLREAAEVLPPTTVPADIRWLTAVSGAGVTTAKPGRSALDFAGKAPLDQVAPWAPLLIVILLLLAIGERTASFFALRRGRS